MVPLTFKNVRREMIIVIGFSYARWLGACAASDGGRARQG